MAQVYVLAVEVAESDSGTLLIVSDQGSRKERDLGTYPQMSSTS